MALEKIQTDLNGVLRALGNAKKGIRKSDLDRLDQEIAELRQAADDLRRRVEAVGENMNAAMAEIREIREALFRLVPIIEGLVIEREAQKSKGKRRWFGG